MADVAGGAYMAVISCMVALWHRVKTGKGQRVDVAIADAILPLLTLQLSQYWGSEGGSQVINPFDGSFPFYGVYECADGKHVSLGALNSLGLPSSDGEQAGMVIISVCHRRGRRMN
jgi:alpha-methylacyl-CoA racemase